MTPDHLCVIVRGIRKNTIVFETRMTIPEADIEKVADELVREHAYAMETGRLQYVEIETPEEPGVALRVWIDLFDKIHLQTYDSRGTIH